jgi:undecaprenyl diphosphate synthase
MVHISSTKEIPFAGAVPQHIAIIMDGNGRWATKRFLPRVAGHVKGVEDLTLFAFSSENWRRPAEEVSLLMRLFVTALDKEISKMHANDVRLKVVGDLSRFDGQLQKMIQAAETKTANNKGLTVTICANYGGRWDVVQAFNRLQMDIKPGEAITEDLLSPYLSMAYAPEPDLFIRTGGETRISNFLLWQLAYSELYFSDTFWPDFDAASLDDAIKSYQARERRFGRTSSQVTDQTS